MMMRFIRSLITGHDEVDRSELISIVSRNIRENFMHISGDERNETGKPGGALPIGSYRVNMAKYGDESRILLSDIRSMRTGVLTSSFRAMHNPDLLKVELQPRVYKKHEQRTI